MIQNPKLGAIFCLCFALGSAIGPGAAVAGLWGYALPDPLTGTTPLDEGWQTDLPPGWLMNRLDPAGQMGPALRDPSVSIDPTAGHVCETYSEGGVEVCPPVVADVDQYNTLLTSRTYRRLWRNESRESRSVTRGAAKPTGLFHVELPFQVPKQLRSILGSGAPNLDVSGSETITLSGVSDWTVRPKGALDTEHRRQSAFPSLEMKQDLQVNLTGSIGDKIKVDVDQSSNVQTSLDNKVKLRYEGDEDDMIKSIDLGNTNLSLQGASIRQEGLFGVKTVAKLGNVDVTTIASKQEGKTETARFTPSGEKRRVLISDLDYIKRQYFFISDHPLVIKPGTLRIFKDDANPSSDNNGQQRAGIARLDPTTDSTETNTQYRGQFESLTEGDHYEITNPYLVSGSNPNVPLRIPVIRLRYPINPGEVLAVAYVEDSLGTDKVIGNPDPYAGEDSSLGKPAQTYLLKMLKPPFGDLHQLTGGQFDPADPWYPTIRYELRNFYDLSARNIALETLNLKIRRRDASQSVDPETTPDGRQLLQVLGLDQWGRTVDEPADGRVDDRFVLADEGILFFPDLHPFDPDTAGAGCPPGHTGFLCLDDTTRNILGSDPALANPNVYYTRSPDFTSQSRYYIDAEFKSSQQGYFIGRFNLLENSEQVKVDGALQKKGQDYNIDYETGQLTFTRPPGPDQVITVDYSFAPGIGQVQRTLLGFSTSYNPSADLSVTSSMLYESRGAQELNPKLGEEPARSMVGDLASTMTFHPSWMTQLANFLPGVHTSGVSTLNLQGNMAVSMPNPNTKGEAYVDDMEGNRESNTLAISRTAWMWSSLPVDTLLQPLHPLLSQHAWIQWYNARHVLEHDLKPVLTKEEGGESERPVLQMNALSPTDGSVVFDANAWTGLTQSVSRTSEDLSRTRFIEIWVNDGTQDHTQTRAKLHIDFGKVSEDAFWQRNVLPNHGLDTEDKNSDTKVDVGEDTGLDGIPDVDESGYGPTNPDPNGDDYHYVNGSDDYSGINGTEGNGVEANSRPDTEDLDLDGRLDEDNAYFEATLDLAGASYVAVDVARDYPGNENVKPTNGWRLFRVPVDSLKAYGRPSWDDVKHSRLWLDGMAGPTNLQIGGIELVGSRWLATPLPEDVKARVGFNVGVRNNKDDAIYVPPYDVQRAVGGSARRREQSLSLSFEKLQRGDSVFAFKTYSDVSGGVGYTQYRDIRFYLHGDIGAEAQSLRAIARFGPDTVNYYEYSVPVRAGWQDIRVPMEILSRLKEESSQRVKIDSVSAADAGVRYTVVGNPSFTRVSRISFGVTAFGASAGGGPGEVWIDELRLDGVRKDVGKAGNFTMQANFADVLALNANYQKQDQDFLRVGTGVNRGSGLNHTALGVQSTLQLGRMMPLSGLELPLRVQYQRASDVPKYRTGSDVVLEEARSRLETRTSNFQSIGFDYHRTGPRKGWTRWTIDAINGRLNYNRTANLDATAGDTSWNFAVFGGYDLPLGGGKGIPLVRGLRLKYLPDLVSFGMNWDARRNTRSSRYILVDSLGAIGDSSVLLSNVPTRLLTLSTNVHYLPINGVTTGYSINSVRDMLVRQESSLGFNKGTEIDHLQKMDLTWSPRRILFLNPNFTLAGLYHENAGAAVRISSSDPTGLKSIDNHGTFRATTSIPLSRFSQRYRTPGPARDTSGTNPLFAPFRFLFSRMQDIQTSFAFDRGASATRVLGDPGFAFKTGFTQKFDPSIYRASNSNIAQTRSFVSGAKTTVQPLTRLSIDVGADHRLTYSEATTGSRRTYGLTWPDLTGRWLQLQDALGLSDILSSLVVTSHYSLKRDEQGPKGKPFETSNRTTNWGPLLRWEASFKNGVRADVNSSLQRTETLNQLSGGIVREHTTTNHDIRLTKVYPASKGIKFPWSKKRMKLPNDVNLNLTVGIARDRSTTERPGIEPYTETDFQRLNVGSGTTYNFTPSITGGFDLGFRQTKDYKTAITQRGITIAVNGQFRF